jgi:segregation and condensation protein A
MQQKKVPWWRKALDYALGGIRSGFGLFPRPVQTVPSVPLVEYSFFVRPEESLKVETVLTDHPKPEALPTVAETAAANTPAAQPDPAPETVSEIPSINSTSPIEPPEEAAPAPEPLIEPPAEVAPVADRSPQTEPPSAKKIEPSPAPEPIPELAAEAEPSPSPSVSTVDPIAPVIESPAVLAAVPDPDPAPIPENPPTPTPKPFIKLESRDDEANLSPFSVVVEQVYDGPLDLLLDLIRKQDIDIYDIPIAIITAQFLAYVNQLKASDVDVAGDFIYIASLLIHIKSKMLLPRSPAGPEDAAEDPRRELVERLLEHERFKNAAQMLQQKQMLEAATWTNPGYREFQGDLAAEPEIAADTVDLVRIFRDILERVRTRPVFDVNEDSVTVGQMIQFLARRLTMEDKPVALRRLLSHTRSERALIAMFLALLELVRMQAILLRQDRAFSEIFIKKHTGFDALMNEGLANARDDWQ